MAIQFLQPTSISFHPPQYTDAFQLHCKNVSISGKKKWSWDNFTTMQWYFLFPYHLYQYWGRAVVSDHAHVSVGHTGVAGDHDQCRGHRPAPVHGPPLPEARAAPWQPPGRCQVPPAHTWWVSYLREFLVCIQHYSKVLVWSGTVCVGYLLQLIPLCSSSRFHLLMPPTLEMEKPLIIIYFWPQHLWTY